MPDSSSPTSIITGGNRGLGFATAARLARHGDRVVLAVRDLAAGQRAAVALRADIPDADVEVWPLDLASLESVRTFAADWGERPIHRLLLNAGVLATGHERRTTADGFELIFGTNHLGHFLLTHLLLDAIKAGQGRVVVVSSSMHEEGNGPGAGPRVDFDDLQQERSFDETVAYRNSKLANIWFTHELARRLEGSSVTVNAVCPGFVPATQTNAVSGMMKFMFRHVMPHMPFARSVDEAADHFFWALTDESLEGKTGKFFADQKERPSSDESYDDEKARRLWTVSEQLTGVSA